MSQLLRHRIRRRRRLANLDGHQAVAAARRTAAIGIHVHPDVEQMHQSADPRGVELAQRLLGRILHLAENRPADIEGAAAFSRQRTSARLPP